MLLECCPRGKIFQRKASSRQIQTERSQLGLLGRLLWLVETLCRMTVVTTATPFMQSVQGACTLRRSLLRWFCSALPLSLRRELHHRLFNLLALELVPSSKKCPSDDVTLLCSGSRGRRDDACCVTRKSAWKGLCCDYADAVQNEQLNQGYSLSVCEEVFFLHH